MEKVIPLEKKEVYQLEDIEYLTIKALQELTQAIKMLGQKVKK